MSANRLLQEYATDVLTRLRQYLLRDRVGAVPRPCIIEFTGPPISGKTTMIGGLDDLLRRSLFRVKRPQEGAEVFRHIPRTDPWYNLTTASYGLINVIEAANDRNHEIVMLDRGLYDAHAWMIYWEQKKKLDAASRELFQKAFTHSVLTADIDLCFFVFCSPRTAFERKKLDSPQSYQALGSGSYTSLESLQKLNAVFQESFETLSRAGRPVLRIDTTALTKPEMFDVVFGHILEMMDRRIQEKSKTS